MGTPLPFRLTLASGSFGRRALLEQAGYTFAVQPADIDEPTDTAFGDIRHYVGDTAWRKAAKVAPTVADGLVLSADTVAWMHGHVIGKPVDRADAKRILQMLSGSVHELWTGVVLWHRPSDRQMIWQERSLVAMRAVSDAELEAYLDTNQWVGASGGYCIRETDDPFLTIVDGSMSNVIGLPMESLAVAFADWERILTPR
ncbi:Maf family protein [Tuwongella immobilis]|uniref:Nucleoside triphosphate pyrophosphatase n=1 Tax=Tuwongella immobilis TaxID=692036 RepID=A0A6C2YIA5_9BACT|nr:Maf family protein [Tuwongella immobilis]VIP01268.1 maf protein : Maf-like protein HGMM_F07G10C21 OS=uncultured planctomycete GN=HGMM_F07G10C21 PE=3 SV=1: Maf [Tuwongella immobilis]VTR97962.1 maf protein : Maf-like protein HGMM_F07G10C21 OS=uncultured planctomycete GN=HGMM_F07G10C21 PE=3 SV=1: Maf [Tuwongella immobilis]